MMPTIPSPQGFSSLYNRSTYCSPSNTKVTCSPYFSVPGGLFSGTLALRRDLQTLSIYPDGFIDYREGTNLIFTTRISLNRVVVFVPNDRTHYPAQGTVFPDSVVPWLSIVRNMAEGSFIWSQQDFSRFRV